MKWLTRSFPIILVLSLLASSCGSDTPAPIVVQPNPVINNSNETQYLNILTSSVKFNGSVGDTDGTGELQLIMIVSDGNGHSDALICPYGAVIEVHTRDEINPCMAGLSYPRGLVQDRLYIMLIALDIDDAGIVADIGTNAVTAGLAFGFEEAIIAFGALNPEAAPVVIGFIALDTILGYAGGQVQEYFEKSDVIGSQSIILSRVSDWENDRPIIAQSTNGEVEYSFVVQGSSTAKGKVVNAAPSKPLVIDTPVITDDSSLSSTTSGSPRIYDFAACLDHCDGTNGRTIFFKKIMSIHLTWKYENIPMNAHYVRSWTHEKQGVWAIYDCTWPGPSSGEDNIRLYDDGGLASGNWVITIKINDVVLLRERIFIEGNFNYWSPAGRSNSCYPNN